MADNSILLTPLRVLIVEDSEFDAVVLVNTLRKGGYEPAYRRVDTREAMAVALAERTWDVILSDFMMPRFSMAEALQLVQESGLDIPFIIVSGGIGEDTAIGAMKAGAHDYMMKGNLARLAPAVTREIREAAVRAARRQAEQSLRESELRYRTLWETSTDAVLLVDHQGAIQFANPAVMAVFGYTSEEILGKNLSVLQPAGEDAPDQIGFQDYLNCPGRRPPGPIEEIGGRRKDGRPLILEVARSEIELHQTRWRVLFIRDITERKINEEKLRQNQEQFRVAREIQQRLFPKAPPEVEAFEIAGASFPADSTGGDYYDYFGMRDENLGVAIGDVSGHGIGPALLMAETRAYIRILARNRKDLGEILTRANLILAEDVSYERFITLFLARLDPLTRRLDYASAGHPAGYVLDAAGQVRCRLKRTGIPLGLQPEASYTAGAPVQLAAGDLVLLLTDGIEETTAPNGEFFDAERVLETVRACRHLPAAQIVEAVYEAVRKFAHNTPQLDDITLVAIKVK
jgi:PAS domain S-box-containing protein